jgi:hypothetical protein
MDLLFQCNLRLVSTSLDESLVVQQTLVQIVGGRHERAVGQAVGMGGRTMLLHPDYRARQFHLER